MLEQLNDPGRLVIPVGPRDDQELLLFEKSAGEVNSRLVSFVRFVPLRGSEGWR